MQHGQLTLFGKRQRKKRAAPEFNLHVLIADILNRWGTPDWRWTHLPFGEHRNAITGARLKRMGTKRGWPDFVLLSPREHLVDGEVWRWPFGKAHFLELKRKGAQLSDDQAELGAWLMDNGYPYRVADNFDEALTILKCWGAVRVSVSA
jgi:hypothetical protein